MSSNVPSCDSKDCFMCKLENQNIIENFKMTPKKKEFSTSKHLIVINILIVIVIILFILNIACNGSLKF